MPGNNQVVNCHCFTILMVLVLVITGYSIMFQTAPKYTRETEFAECIAEEVSNEALQQNYTICVSCADKRYQLTSVRDADEEKKCGEKAKLHGIIPVDDCCVKVSVTKQNTTFEAIFGLFIGLFFLSFVYLYYIVHKEIGDSQQILAPTEASEVHQQLVPQPVPMMMGVAPTYGSRL